MLLALETYYQRQSLQQKSTFELYRQAGLLTDEEDQIGVVNASTSKILRRRRFFLFEVLNGPLSFIQSFLAI